MSSSFILLNDIQNASPTDYRARVIVVGVALLFVYVTNYISQAYVTFGQSQNNKQHTLKKLLQTSQIMYWFGIASIFSIFPPFYYGVFNAVMSFITLVVVVLMHFFCFNTGKIKTMSLWAISYFIYYLLITIWIIVGLGVAYHWTGKINLASI